MAGWAKDQPWSTMLAPWLIRTITFFERSNNKFLLISELRATLRLRILELAKNGQTVDWNITLAQCNCEQEILRAINVFRILKYKRSELPYTRPVLFSSKLRLYFFTRQISMHEKHDTQIMFNCVYVYIRERKDSYNCRCSNGMAKILRNIANFKMHKKFLLLWNLFSVCATIRKYYFSSTNFEYYTFSLLCSHILSYGDRWPCVWKIKF